jgi:hypothetical protein
MGRGKLSRYVGTLLFFSAITCMIGFWWARTNGSESWIYWAQGLKWTLITLAACAAYMAGVGLYHTALAALGLDGEPGLFSKGARSGPFSGPPVDAHHARVVPGAGAVPEPADRDAQDAPDSPH